MPTGFGWDFKTQYQKCQWDAAEYKGRQYTDALYEKVTGSIARITFNRPEKRNALNDSLFSDFHAGLHQANEDPEVKVVIIRGAGAAFGSGHDLTSPKQEESPPINPALNPTVVDYYGFERRRCGKHEDIMNFPKITIAQIHGACVGATEIIADSCDFIIAAEDAKFGVRGFGRMPLWASNWPGCWPAGSNKIYGGSLLPEISGKEAEAIGLVNKAVHLEKLEEEVMKWAEGFSFLPLETLVVVKEWFNGMVDMAGFGACQRFHYDAHLQIQYTRFRPDEVNFYKKRRDKGLKGFITARDVAATPKG